MGCGPGLNVQVEDVGPSKLIDNTKHAGFVIRGAPVVSFFEITFRSLRPK